MSEREEHEEEDARRPRTAVTLTLVVVNVAVFLTMASAGASILLTPVDALVAFGALDAPRVWKGEVWRLVTAMFVHGGAWHLLLNMWVLLQVGRGLELALGSARYLLLYVASGVLGFALSLLVHPGITAGASGAIFGVVGGLLGLAFHARGLKIGKSLASTLLPFVVGTLALGFLIPFVDNSAHVGGLVLGALLGFGFSSDLRLEGVTLTAPRATRDRRLGAAALVVALAALAVLVPASLRPVFSPRWAVTLGLDAVKRGALDEAWDLQRRAAELAPQDGAVLALTARLKAETGDADADAFFAQALRSFDETAPDRALGAAMAALGRGADPDRFEIHDELMTDGLCRAALGPEGELAVAEVLNNCAWFKLNAERPGLADPAGALPLALRAVKLTLDDRPVEKLSTLEKETAAAYLHTLAVAREKSGDLDEARLTLERIVTQGFSSQRFYAEELDRVGRRARKLPDRPPPPAPSPPASPDAGMGQTGP